MIVCVFGWVGGWVCSIGINPAPLSVGAKPFTPPIPGIERAGNFVLRNLEDMDKIDAWLK